MTSPKSEDIKHADDILKQYSEPYSCIDNGNLFFAATTFQEAYEKLETKLAIAKEALERIPRSDMAYGGSIAEEALKRMSEV